MRRTPVTRLLHPLGLLALTWSLAAASCLEPDAAPVAPHPAAAPYTAPERPAAESAPSAGSAPPAGSTAATTQRAAPRGTAPRTRPSDPTLARLADKPLRYTQHGRCRMDCRHISEAEVEALLTDGHIAPDRTRRDGECVSYAVEGRTDDGQDVRIVYADCDRETRVVTTIDLGRDWPCSCR
ncbi:MAG: DUF4258 domain-containing protein [Myxococcales bacterium]|nr:DUF4258 domain-containing protein [Myxococcales bacterium]